MRIIKIFASAAAAATIVSCMAVAASALNKESRYLRGDTNGDEIVSVSDVTMIQKYLIGALGLFPADLLAADVNSDGIVDINDATEIQKYTAEFENTHLIGKWIRSAPTEPTASSNTQPSSHNAGENELPFIPDP